MRVRKKRKRKVRHHPPLAMVPQGAGHPRLGDIEPAKKASPKSADEHLNSAYCALVVLTCVLQPCLEFLLLYFSHGACCLRSSSPRLRRRRRRRMRPPRNDPQIRTHRLRAMNRRTQLRYSSLRDRRRQASPGSNRQQLLKLPRVQKQRHGRSSATLALRTERLLGSQRFAFWD